MRHHDRPGPSEDPQAPARPDGPEGFRDPARPDGPAGSRPPVPAGRAGGRHRRAGGARRHGPRRPSFRTAVALSGSAAVVLTVVAGMYVAAPATGTPAAAAPRGAAAPEGAATGKAARFVRDVVSLVNAEREKAGCGPLRSEGQLRSAAQGHADDMAARDYYEHHSPEGRDAGDRMSGAGYEWSTWGENIHRGPKTPARAMEDWMDSPGHRANILNCSFKDIGVGVTLAANGPWWVQDFGARR
ncbi:CAP domain-containing protein [Streptomyces sp. NPDC020472]|uniref:CAP domain-containing protein n=1 Tax=unclassified Streptomyces TaxID=2593676 RepID=UPI0036B1CC04